MKLGFIKPTYIHYANKWEFNWLSISFNKKIMISPAIVTHTAIICLFGYGVVIRFVKKYTPVKSGKAEFVDTSAEDFIDGKNGK